MSLTVNDLMDVYKITFGVRNKWRNVLLLLSINNTTIDSIGVRWRESPDDCYREGILEWLKGGNRSWRDLMVALSGPIVGHSDIAKAIERHRIQRRVDPLPPHQKMNEDLLIFTNENIGAGAFGAVFKGLYKSNPCAVKLLHHVTIQMQTNLPASTEATERGMEALQREFELLKSFQHPNVVEYLATCNHPKSGGTVLVVELMDCSLRSYLSRLGEESLTSECEVSLSNDVASGLAYIHSKQIIHRDLCSDNVLLNLAQIPLAKISDFGNSRLFDPDQLSSTLAAVSHRMGFLPPEALRMDDDNYDQSLDVFSFGVVIVQIVHKRPTIKSAKDRSYYFGQTPLTHKLRPLIDGCLQKDVKRRPSARELCIELGGLLKEMQPS